MSAPYPTEWVDCSECDGLGEDIDRADDPLDWHQGRCFGCAGAGQVRVCANCYDEFGGCSVCQPPDTALVPAAAPVDEEQTT